MGKVGSSRKIIVKSQSLSESSSDDFELPDLPPDYWGKVDLRPDEAFPERDAHEEKRKISVTRQGLGPEDVAEMLGVGREMIDLLLRNYPDLAPVFPSRSGSTTRHLYRWFDVEHVRIWYLNVIHSPAEEARVELPPIPPRARKRQQHPAASSQDLPVNLREKAQELIKGKPK